MSCAFDLAHYAELLDAARAGGYRFSFFEGEPHEGDVLLRHDVDFSLDGALRLAEVELDRVLFVDVLEKYFGGVEDPATLERL